MQSRPRHRENGGKNTHDVLRLSIAGLASVRYSRARTFCILGIVVVGCAFSVVIIQHHPQQPGSVTP